MSFSFYSLDFGENKKQACQKLGVDRILHGSKEKENLAIGILHFSNVHLMPLCFYKRPKLVPILISNNNRNAKRIFTFTEKMVKSENRFSIYFCREPSTEAITNSESGITKLSPQELHSEHQAVMALNCFSDHLHFVSIYFVHLLPRCFLR